MGRTAQYVRAQQQGTRTQRNDRQERTQAARAKRRGEDDAARTIQKVVARRPLPGETDQALLLSQFAQSCRLTGPSYELCHLLRHYAGLTGGAPAARDAATTVDPSNTIKGAPRHKRAREEPAAEEKKNVAALEAIADALIATESAPLNDDDDGEEETGAAEDDVEDTVLLDILQSECGRRVVATLLASLSAVGSKSCAVVAKVVLAQFEENEHLAEHHVACRVMSALVQYGPSEVQQGVLNLFRERATTIESIRSILTDRHTAGTVENLLKHFTAATVAWLSEVCGIDKASTSVASKSKKPAAKAKKAQATSGSSDMTTEDLLSLVEDPVAGQVMRLLAANDSNVRAALLGRFDAVALLESKRGTALLSDLLATPASEDDAKTTSPPLQPEAATALVKDMVAQLGLRFSDMAVDKKANFVIQRIAQILPFAAPDSAQALFSSIVAALGGDKALKDLAVNPIGVHVVVTLVQTAAQLQKNGGRALEEIGAMLVTSHNVGDLIVHQHGSLVVRQLMSLVAVPSSKVGQLLKSTMEHEGSVLAYDRIGNLVMQEYLRALGPAGASAYGKKLSKDSEELLRMCRDPSASHVVYALLGLVDPQTHTALCDVLKRHVVPLATHLNGRFIIEKLLVANRDIRDDLVRRFSVLAQEKGTQHVLCTLVANLDPRGKESIIDNTIMPHIMDMATHACASIVLQKLMQLDAPVREAVQKRLSQDVALRHALLQNFFGKFVVQIAQNDPVRA